jgi:hypothetical protein
MRQAEINLPVAEVARLRVVRKNPKSGDFGYGTFKPAGHLNERYQGNLANDRPPHAILRADPPWRVTWFATKSVIMAVRKGGEWGFI